MVDKKRLTIELTHKDNDGIFVFALKGSVDLDGARGLEGLANVCILQGVTRIILDLSGVNELTAPGLGAFFEFSREMEAQKGRLVLVKLSNKVKQTFRLHEVLDQFSIATSTEKAIAQLKDHHK